MTQAVLDKKQGLYIFSKQEEINRAYWVTRREQDFAVSEFPGCSTRFLQVPAHIFTYLLGRAERLLWQAEKA